MKVPSRNRTLTRFGRFEVFSILVVSVAETVCMCLHAGNMIAVHELKQSACTTIVFGLNSVMLVELVRCIVLCQLLSNRKQTRR
jgi:hypothetical protein